MVRACMSLISLANIPGLTVARPRRMKHCLALLFAAALVAQTPPPSLSSSDSNSDVDELVGNRTAETNVNSRYTVESVNVANQHRYFISRSILEDMHHLVGARFNTDSFQSLAERISNELHGYRVVFRLARGADPDHVRVTFVVEGPTSGLSVEFPKALYNSRQGFTAEGDAIITAGANRFLFGALTNNDDLPERFAGVRARYERLSVGSERVQLSFEFNAYHADSMPASQTAAMADSEVPLLYRSYRNFEPMITIALAGPLTYAAGISFQQFDPQFAAVHTESANAVVNTLRFERRWEDSANYKHRLEAGYNLRAATSFLGADYVYTRHTVHAHYSLKHGRQSADVSFLGGDITGRAPLFERFVLGNSSTLRGWNMYDIDPLGGTKVVHGSVGYGYRIVRVFYDTGAVWDGGTHPKARSSAGVGIKVEGILLAVAFPIRNDRVEPVFIAGMSF